MCRMSMNTFLIVFFLVCVQLPHSMIMSQNSLSKLSLFNFQNVSNLNIWTESSDTVRVAGRSKATFDLYRTSVGQRAIFFTVLNPLPNGACFAGVRTPVEWNLFGYQYISFKCNASGSATIYKLVLRHNHLEDKRFDNNPTYEQLFKVNNTGQETFVKLDISMFMPYFRGQLLEVGPILNSGCITSFGIQVGGGVYEKFKQKGKKQQLPVPSTSDDTCYNDEVMEEANRSEDEQHTDWVKLACLICKRQFSSKDILIKHQQMSELHKQNIRNWYNERGLDPDDESKRVIQYRDRAKERRMKYNEPDKPLNNLKDKYMKAKEATVDYEQPTKLGIGSDNRGNKLLQKMGWQEGMGLGKTNQGRTTIIEAEGRLANAGLGTRAVGVVPGPRETYKDCVKKMMRYRYNESD